MGWRERDWAKLTDAERRAIYGGGSSTSPGSFEHRFGSSSAGSRRLRGISLRAGAASAVLASAALFAAGQLPKDHPLLPALHVKLPTIRAHASSEPVRHRSRRFVRLQGPRIVPSGSVITSRGTLDPPISGAVLVQGRWRPHEWKTLGGAYVKNGSWTVRYRLVRRGTVHIRMSLPDGSFAIATIRVV
jgi:hypothetical protein